MTIEGGTTTESFLEFIDKHLAPMLRPGGIVVMHGLGARQLPERFASWSTATTVDDDLRDARPPNAASRASVRGLQIDAEVGAHAGADGAPPILRS